MGGIIIIISIIIVCAFLFFYYTKMNGIYNHIGNVILLCTNGIYMSVPIFNIFVRNKAYGSNRKRRWTTKSLEKARNTNNGWNYYNN